MQQGISMKAKFLIFLIFLSAVTLLGREMRWNWSKINTDLISFPKDFSWGVALSEYQNSGTVHCPRNNWTEWEYSTDIQGKPRIQGGQKSGKACDFWDNWRNDISLLKELGVDSLRLSLEWSCIEPECGFFDKSAVEHYKELFKALQQENIKPLVTLHHFTEPLWFKNRGSFEKKENIAYFVRFCKHIFEELADVVPAWVTFNEPGVYVFQGYIRGVFPPGKTDIKLASRVLKNILKAHVQTYKTLKNSEKGKKTQIGIVHQHVQFEPYHEYNPLEGIVAKYMNVCMCTPVFEFLRTGIYKFEVPLVAQTLYKDLDAPYCYDFIGLNYYSHFLVATTWPKVIEHHSGYREYDIPTDMPYGGIYAEGLYRAIKTFSQLHVPIYITECGIADKHDNRRELFLKRYLYALSSVIQEGYNVRGFYYWSLMDNFEWDMGYSMKFGLYEVNFETQQRTLRNGSRYFADVIKRMK
jgi:beta-glucosidase